MKIKVLISFLLALLPLMVVAQRISDAEAMSIAASVLDKPVTKAVSSKPLRAPSVNGGAEIAQPFFDIYTGDDGHGFVIVSTDHRAPQVIGYGEGKCDPNNLPPQLAAILAKQDSVLNADSSLPEHPSWQQRAPRLAEAGEGGKLLKTANWGQGYPYNLMTPEIDGEHCPTGCVATAMAIIMKYHGWPEKGRGQHTYNWNGEDLSFDYANTTFDWSQMPEVYEEENFTEAQAQEVSKLMKAAGNAVEMSYSKHESSSYMASVLFNLYRYFKYDLPRAMNKDKIYFDYPEISDKDWFQYIVNELESDRILLYSTQMHCFVIDGYSAEMLHINWGWEGLLNGYFNIITSDTPLGNVNGGTVVTLINPDKEATNDFSTVVFDDGSNCSLMNGGYSQGINIDATNLECGGHYRAVISSLLYTSNQGKIRPGLALVDQDDCVKEFYPHAPEWMDTDLDIDYKNVPWGIKPEVGIDITVPVSPSDRIKVVYQREGYDGYLFAKNAPYVNAYCPVVDNVPDYINVDWDIDEGIDLTLSLGSLSYAEYHHPINNILRRSTALIRVKSSIGHPAIYINGEKESAVDPWGIRSIIGCHKNYSVRITNILFSDMIDLSINVETEGSLSSYISNEETPLVRRLKLYGRINYNDLSFIRENLTSIEELDLSETEYIPDNFIGEAYVLVDAGLIRDLKLPRNLKGIGNCTFAAVRGLEKIYIPSSVEFIGMNAFALCQSLKTVIVGSPTPVPLLDDPIDISTSTFFNSTPLKQTGILYVPKGSKSTYENAEFWKDFPNIIEYEGEWKDVENIKLNNSKLFLQLGETDHLTATVTPDDATDKTVTWSSSDSSVATVDNDGNITAVAEGETTIIAICGTVEAICTVTVTKVAQEIMWEQAFDEVFEGDVLTLTATATSGLTVEYEIVIGADKAMLNGDELTISEAGEIHITACQPGNDMYEAAEPITKVINAQSGIIGVTADGVRIHIEGSELIVEGDIEIEIYKSDGTLLYRGKDSRISIPKNGVYIIRYAGRAVKITTLN